MRRVALERVPALDGAFGQLLAAADDVDRAAGPRSRRSAGRGPSSASVLIIQFVHVQEPVQLPLIPEAGIHLIPSMISMIW